MCFENEGNTNTDESHCKKLGFMSHTKRRMETEQIITI